MVHKKKEVTLIITSKTRFYKLPATAKVFLGLSKIEGKGNLVKTKCLKKSESLKGLKLSEITMHRT